MAWTAPATWAIDEIVTASKMNTHVRDNLAYLKGAAGTIAFDAGATFAGVLTVTGGNGIVSISTSSAANPTITSTNDSSVNSLFFTGRSGLAATSGKTIIQNASNNDIILTTTGKIGISQNTPTGKLHILDSISGFIKWDFDGLAGVAQTVIANGAGDVLYAFAFASLVRSSTGTVQVLFWFNGTVTPGGAAQTIFSSGGEVATLSCAADGSITVQRTGGTATFKISIMGHWL